MKKAIDFSRLGTGFSLVENFIFAIWKYFFNILQYYRIIKIEKFNLTLDLQKITCIFTWIKAPIDFYRPPGVYLGKFGPDCILDFLVFIFQFSKGFERRLVYKLPSCSSLCCNLFNVNWFLFFAPPSAALSCRGLLLLLEMLISKCSQRNEWRPQRNCPSSTRV